MVRIFPVWLERSLAVGKLSTFSTDSQSARSRLVCHDTVQAWSQISTREDANPLDRFRHRWGSVLWNVSEAAKPLCIALTSPCLRIFCETALPALAGALTTH